MRNLIDLIENDDANFAELKEALIHNKDNKIMNDFIAKVKGKSEKLDKIFHSK